MTFVDDKTGTLGTDAIGRINSATSSLDVKVVVTSTGSRGELDGMVGRLVNSANTVAIGVDPIHRYTFTHFGTGTGISSGDYQAIARAGNGEFKAGHWEQGIEAIIAASNAASVRTSSRLVSTTERTSISVTTIEHPVSAWPFILGFAALAVGVLLVARWLKKRSAEQARVLDGFREEASQMRSRNVEEQGWHDKFKAGNDAAASRPSAKAANNPARPAGTADQPAPTKTPEQKDREAYQRNLGSYPPAVVHHHHGNGGGGNDLLTGMLIGNAISAPRETVVVRERRRTPTPAPSSSSSSDWGSSSSSDGGSSGGGFDSGGGGFDSGGGGGFDGGSGGGDF